MDCVALGFVLVFLCSLSSLLGCRSFPLRVRVSAGGGGFLLCLVVVSLLGRLLVALAQYSDSPPFVKCRRFCTAAACTGLLWS